MSTPNRDDVGDFQAWLSAQGIAADSLTSEQSVLLRRIFDEAARRAAKLSAQFAPSRSARETDRRYAVAVQDGEDLGLTFWIKRSAKGEIFLLYPGEPEMDPHASYHRDGTYHQKSYRQATSMQKRQPLDCSFRGTEHLGTFAGHGAGPRIVDSEFDDVLVAPPGVLSGTRGCVAVDLIEPGAQPAPHHRKLLRIVEERTYRDASPWIVVTIAATSNNDGA